MQQTKLERLMALLTAYVNANGLLTHYREDLDVHDQSILQQLSGWPVFMWIVGETYSYLYPVGFTKRCHDDARAVFQARFGGPMHICMIHPQRVDTRQEFAVVPVTLEEAKEALDDSNTMKVVDGKVLTPTGEYVGNLTIDYEFLHQSSRWLGLYAYEPAEASFLFREEWVPQLALSEAVTAKGLWCAIGSKSEADLLKAA